MSPEQILQNIINEAVSTQQLSLTFILNAVGLNTKREYYFNILTTERYENLIEETINQDLNIIFKDLEHFFCAMVVICQDQSI